MKENLIAVGLLITLGFVFALQSPIALATYDQKPEPKEEANVGELRGLEHLPGTGPSTPSVPGGIPTGFDAPEVTPSSASSTYPDGSTITRTENPDGSRIVTHTDADGNVTSV